MHEIFEAAKKNHHLLALTPQSPHRHLALSSASPSHTPRRSLWSNFQSPHPLSLIAMPLHADLCTILQNASRARLRSIPLASTKDNLSILSILLQHGFIHNVVRGTQTGPSPTSYTAASPAARRLWVDLKFRPDDRPVLEKMNVVSKPSRKLTMDKDELLRLATGRRAKFVKPLDMGEIGIVDCGKNGWWEVRDAIRRGYGGEVVARVS